MCRSFAYELFGWTTNGEAGTRPTGAVKVRAFDTQTEHYGIPDTVCQVTVGLRYARGRTPPVLNHAPTADFRPPACLLGPSADWPSRQSAYLRRAGHPGSGAEPGPITEYTAANESNEESWQTLYVSSHLGSDQTWLRTLNMIDLIMRLEVPVFFLAGRYDYNKTPSVLAEAASGATRGLHR